MMIKIIFFIAFTPLLVFAGETNVRQGLSLEEFTEVANYNRELALRESLELSPLSSLAPLDIEPFFEGDETGYVVMSADTSYGSQDIKDSIAQNLPNDVTLIVYTQNSQSQKRLLKHYSNLISKDRLVILPLSQGGRTNFWSRDNLPFPVWIDGAFSLSDARYYYSFEPDEEMQSLWNVDMVQHDYFFEGGNLITSENGDCIVVNRKRRYPLGVSDTAAIPDNVFKNNYGCKNLIRLKHLKGIGHADEVVKFMGDGVILTDTPEYTELLEKEGFSVTLLPEPDSSYGTYINALLVNNTAFVPVYGEDADADAISAYESLGYNVIPLNSVNLSRRGQGSIHCITMNYPPANLETVIKVLKENL